jgi:hypothetical protein
VYRQQWQADQQKKIIAQMDGKNPHKSNENKWENRDRNHHNSNGGRSSTHHGNSNRGGLGDRGRGRGGDGGRTNNSEHLKDIECFNCGKKVHYYTDFSQPRKKQLKLKHGFQNGFQKPVSILIEGYVDQEERKEQR